MEEKDKDLLLNELCARFPHGVKILHRGSVQEIAEISPEGCFKNRNYNAWFNIETCKPYLRPMSSMTEEEKKELENYFAAEAISSKNGVFEVMRAQRHTSNFLYSRHLDVLGLIEKGLALEAPKDMYYNVL